MRGRGPGRAGGRKEGGLGLSAAAGGRCGLPGAGGPSRRPPGPGSAARCRASPKLAPAGRAWPARCPSALFLCWAGLAGASSLPPPSPGSLVTATAFQARASAPVPFYCPLAGGRRCVLRLALGGVSWPAPVILRGNAWMPEGLAAASQSDLGVLGASFSGLSLGLS